jgi:hypothetical protein
MLPASKGRQKTCRPYGRHHWGSHPRRASRSTTIDLQPEATEKNMIYEIATLSVHLGAATNAIAGVGGVKAPGAKGTLLGCWSTEISELNQLVVLRGFTDHAELLAERECALGTTDPFDARDAIASLRFDSYAPFRFLPPGKPAKYGAVYEIRTYKLKHGGVPNTIAALGGCGTRATRTVAFVDCYVRARWSTAIHAHLALCQSRCPRRGACRLCSEGIWPPKGGPNWLTGDMRTVIGLPTAISPLT